MEHIFGVIKKRFPVLNRVMEGWYLEVQGKIVHALCIIHNFIVEAAFDDDISIINRRRIYYSRKFEENEGIEIVDQNNEGYLVRETIASNMWNQYQNNFRNNNYVKYLD